MISPENRKTIGIAVMSIVGFLIMFMLFIFSRLEGDRLKTQNASPENKQKELTADEVIEANKKSDEELRQRILKKEEEEKALVIEDKKFLKSKAGRIYKKHPEWSKDDCQRLADGKIWIGMTYSMLKYTNGLPDHANPSNYGTGTQWQWCWDDFTPSCYYDHDDDGKIDSYN